VGVTVSRLKRGWKRGKGGERNARGGVTLKGIGGTAFCKDVPLIVNATQRAPKIKKTIFLKGAWLENKLFTKI